MVQSLLVTCKSNVSAEAKEKTQAQSLGFLLDFKRMMDLNRLCADVAMMLDDKTMPRGIRAITLFS